MTADPSGPADLGQFRPYLHRVARDRLPPEVRAKMDESDVVQLALLKAHQNYGQFRGRTPAELQGWLRRIVLSLVVDARRLFGGAARTVGREAAPADPHFSAVAAEQTSPSQRAARGEHAGRLAGALAGLPADQRDAVDLHYLQGLTLAEVAARMGRTNRSVAGLLQRGLERLRGELDPREERGDRPADGP